MLVTNTGFQVSEWSMTWNPPAPPAVWLCWDCGRPLAPDCCTTTALSPREAQANE